MIEIDGSFGEGGGQILRTSLALSLVTGKAFKINNIRAGRRKPGLMRQHLTAVKAATMIGGAEVKGDSIGSMELYFAPRDIRPGEYNLVIGTAGSCSLVLQTILPALITADKESKLILEGGTHNPFAPPFDFLVKAFLPLINKMGARINAVLERPGFYPAGGGRLRLLVAPSGSLNPVEITERGEIKGRFATAYVAGLPARIGERELKIVAERLSWENDSLRVREISSTRSPGNILSLEVESGHITEVFTGFGKRGVPAEQVAEEAVNEARVYLEADVPVGKYLADQLLIPIALAGRGKFRTLSLSNHTTTNMEVIGRFLDINISGSQVGENAWEVEINPAGG